MCADVAQIQFVQLVGTLPYILQGYVGMLDLGMLVRIPDPLDARFVVLEQVQSWRRLGPTPARGLEYNTCQDTSQPQKHGQS